jgi:serine/threonine protein phosphatase PrpC
MPAGLMLESAAAATPRAAPCAAAARQLVDLALDAGSRDNVTAVVADVIVRADAGEGWLRALL